MTRRSRAREVVLQLLFQFDVNPDVPRSLMDRLVRERWRDAELIPSCVGLYDGTINHRREIDEKLSAASENWRLTRMTAVDRNVLRLGAFELLHASSETPA